LWIIDLFYYCIIFYPISIDLPCNSDALRSTTRCGQDGVSARPLFYNLLVAQRCSNLPWWCNDMTDVNVLSCLIRAIRIFWVIETSDFAKSSYFLDSFPIVCSIKRLIKVWHYYWPSNLSTRSQSSSKKVLDDLCFINNHNWKILEERIKCRLDCRHLLRMSDFLTNQKQQVHSVWDRGFFC
jgi:hypothetical protein